MPSHRDTTTTSRSGRDFDVDLSQGDIEFAESARPGRDWKKLVLVTGLGVLSWVATYIGMLELIEANMGELPLIHKGIIGFSVAMLMTMIIWLLDQLFAPLPLFTKLSYAAGYVFLTIISVGFGFGFYWKVLESRSESARSAESAVTQVQSSLHAASTRMTQLSTTLDQLNQVSNEKAEIERTKGTSCPNSRPGDGPRRKLREDDAQRFGFAAEFVKARVGSVNGELKALDGDLARIASDDKSIVDAKSGTRNDFMRNLGRKLDMTVTGFNAFRTDPQLKQIRADLAERADKTVFADGRNETFACPDAQLQQALKGVVRAIDQLPELEKPQIAAVEGSEATIEAFRRLTATFYGLLAFKMPPSADELRELQKKAVQSVEASPQTQAQMQRALSSDQAVGLSKRDYIPLAIALFVDLCLLLVSMGRPINRLHGLVPKMRAAERGPVIQILSRFNDIHRDDEIRKNFEVFRHVVFDFHGAYYVAVPLDAAYKPSGPYSRSTSTEDIEALQLEAHLLANLFTSFEQEKIFSRVYSPLLTTRVVKKKLQRQGSKFANAESFRVYRFRDGAWSEIILGAVMGAARRVEAEKKKRRLEEQLFAQNTKAEPTLAAANDHTQPAATSPAATVVTAESAVADAVTATLTGNVREMSAGQSARGGFFARRAAEASVRTKTEPPVLATSAATAPSGNGAGIDPAIADEFGPYARRRTHEIAEEQYRSTLPTLRGQDGILERPRRRRNERTRSADVETDTDDIPAGEVVLFARPGNEAANRDARVFDKASGEVPAAPHAVTAPVAAPTGAVPTQLPAREAPNASATALDAVRPISAAVVAELASAEPDQRIGVVIRRETAEFTMPASEARLPREMFASALRQANHLATATSPVVQDETTTPVIAPSLPPPLPLHPAGVPANAIAQAQSFELEPVADEIEVEAEPLFAEPEIDIHFDAISRRFRPTAAE